MISLQKSVSVLAIAATLAGGLGAAALAETPNAAQSPAAHAATAPMPGDMGKDWGHGHWGHGKGLISPMRLLDGKLAFFKAVLQITPAQQADFEKFADAARAALKDHMGARMEMHHQFMGHATALDRLTAMAKMSEMRAHTVSTLLSAFKPLYQSLSPEQQKIADHIANQMARRHMMMHRRMMFMMRQHMMEGGGHHGMMERHGDRGMPGGGGMGDEGNW
jgi:periplasmic protein CpxP/Spy